MPAVVVDSVVVTGGWDPSALNRGLQESNARLRQFVQSTANTRVALGIDLNVARLADELADLSLAKIPPLKLPVTVDAAQIQAAIAELTSTGKAITIKVGLEGADDVRRGLDKIQTGISPDAFNALLQATERVAVSVESLTGFFGGLALGMADVLGEIQAIQAAGASAFTPLIDGAQRSIQELQALQAAETKAAAAASGAGIGGAAALSATEATAGFNGLIAAQARVASGNRAMAEGIALSSRQFKVYSDAVAAAQTGTGKMAAGVALAGAQFRELAAATGASVPNLTKVAKGGAGVEALGHGARQTALHFVTMTAASAGADTAVSRLAANLLGLSIGFGAVSIGAIAIFAAAKAWDFFTEGARKAKEEVKKAGEALDQLRESQRDPVTINLEFKSKVDNDIDATRAKLKGLIADRDELVASGRTLVPNIGGAVAAIQIERLNSAINNTGKELDNLEAKSNAGGFAILAETARRAADAAQQATDDQLAIVRVGFQRQQQALEAAQAQGITTRHAFSAQAIQIAVDEAAAVVRALKDQRIRVLERPTGNVGQQEENRKEVAHLTRLIDLEGAKLALEEQRIRNARILADLQSLTPEAPAKLEFQPNFKTRDTPLFDPGTISNLQSVAGVMGEVDASIRRIMEAAAQARVDDEIEKWRLKAEELFELMDPMAEKLREIGISLKDLGNANVTGSAAAGMNKTQVIFDQTAQAIDSIRDGLKGVGADAGDAIGNVADLAKAVKNLASGNPAEVIAGIVGAIKSVGNLLGIGKSQTEIELERAIRENAQAVRQNTEAFRRRFDTIGGLGEQETLARNAINNPAAQAAIESGDLNAFREAVQSTGITLDELREIARAHGISLVHDHHLVEGASLALQQALDQAVDAATHFSQRFGDQLDFSDLKARINGGLGTAADQFARDLAAAGKVGAVGIVDLFKDIDLGDPKAFQERMNELLEKFSPDSTFFKEHPDLLGDLGMDDWKKILQDGAAAVEEMRNKVKSFSDSLASGQLRSRIAGEDQSTAAVFQREIQAFARQSAAFREQFANIDVGDPEAVRAALLKLFDQVAAGTLPDNLTIEDLNTLFADGAGFLDEFNKGVAGATKKLGDFNIPSTFKRALLAFQNANLGPDTPARPVTLTPFTGPLSNLIQPLPAEVQRTLDAIATATPPDLLTSLGELRAVTEAGPQSVVDGLQRIADVLSGTQLPPGTPLATSPVAVPQGQTVITVGQLVMNVTQLPGESGEDFSRRVVDRLERLGVLQTGNNRSFGPFG